MQNNPLALGLIVGGIVLVLVAVILYFLVFRKMIKSACERGKANRAERRVKQEKSTNLASNVFGERNAETQSKVDARNQEIQEIEAERKRQEKAKEMEKFSMHVQQNKFGSILAREGIEKPTVAIIEPEEEKSMKKTKK